VKGLWGPIDYRFINDTLYARDNYLNLSKRLNDRTYDRPLPAFDRRVAKYGQQELIYI